MFDAHLLINGALSGTDAITRAAHYRRLGGPGQKWAAFRATDEWKALSTSPRYAFEAIVSNINNSILTPTPYSEI